MDSGNNTMEIERRAFPSSGGRRSDLSMIWAALAVLVGMALGLGVLFWVREARRARSTQLTTTTGADAAVPAHPPASLAVPPPPPPPVPTAEADAGITIDVDDVVVGRTAPFVTLNAPEGSKVFVDNKELPAGVYAIPRPDAGFVTALVRAEGRNDAILIIDPTSLDVLDVKMTRKKKPAPDAAAPSAPAPSLAMPPNPYD